MQKTTPVEDKFQAVLRDNLQDLASMILMVGFAPDDPDLISQAIRGCIEEGADLIVTSGGMSVDPDDMTRARYSQGRDMPYGLRNTCSSQCNVPLGSYRKGSCSGTFGLRHVSQDYRPRPDPSPDTDRRVDRPQTTCPTRPWRPLPKLPHLPLSGL